MTFKSTKLVLSYSELSRCTEEQVRVSTLGISDSSSVPNTLRPRRSMIFPLSRSAPTGLPASAGMDTPTQETAHSHVRPYFVPKIVS